MPKPKPGESYRYAGEEPFGGDHLAMRPGTLVKVRELVPADVAGAHTSNEDAVVVEWEQPEVGYDDQGKPALLNASRATSFGVESFGDMFEAVA